MQINFVLDTQHNGSLHKLGVKYVPNPHPDKTINSQILEVTPWLWIFTEVFIEAQQPPYSAIQSNIQTKSFKTKQHNQLQFHLQKMSKWMFLVQSAGVKCHFWRKMICISTCVQNLDVKAFFNRLWAACSLHPIDLSIIHAVEIELWPKFSESREEFTEEFVLTKTINRDEK